MLPFYNPHMSYKLLWHVQVKLSDLQSLRTKRTITNEAVTCDMQIGC